VQDREGFTFIRNTIRHVMTSEGLFVFFFAAQFPERIKGFAISSRKINKRKNNPQRT
jgi:hypothetical protein